MIVDTSVMAAIILDEPERAMFAGLIQRSAARKISAASVVELVEVYHRKLRAVEPLKSLVADLTRLDITIVAVTTDQALVAAEARLIYGKGTGHPAQLNFGDCFSYALAKIMRQPLLFKGNDFIHTDVARVI